MRQKGEKVDSVQLEDNMEIISIYNKFKECGVVTTDTRTLKGGEMFVALKGENFDGNEYALKALELGARYAVVNRSSKVGTDCAAGVFDADVAARAKEAGSTRAAACMEKACEIEGPVIIAVGNAPTALVRLDELVKEGKIKPELVIGVPVGFVNVVESKEIIMQTGVPYIVARGRKGGSNVAAAICNALIYKLVER